MFCLNGGSQCRQVLAAIYYIYNTTRVLFFCFLVIYIYTIFMGDTMYYFYLFIRAVRPVPHYAIFFFLCGHSPSATKMRDVSVRFVVPCRYY